MSQRSQHHRKEGGRSSSSGGGGGGGGLFVGIVKSVLSADTIVLMHPKRRPPVEKRIHLSNLRTPRLGRKKGGNRRRRKGSKQPQPEETEESAKDEIIKEEDYAFEAREFVRNLLIGRKVLFEINYHHETNKRDYGDIFLLSEEEMKSYFQNPSSLTREHKNQQSLSYLILKNGFGKLLNTNQSPQLFVDTLLNSQKQKIGMFSDSVYEKRNLRFDVPTFDIFQKYCRPKEANDQNKGWIPVIVEYVIHGHFYRVMFPDYEYSVVSLTGVRCVTNPRNKYYDQIKYFVEHHLLHKFNIFLKIDGYDSKYDSLLVTFRVGGGVDDSIEHDDDDDDDEKKSKLVLKKLECDENPNNPKNEAIFNSLILKRGYGEFIEFLEPINVLSFPFFKLLLNSEKFAKKNRKKMFSKYDYVDPEESSKKKEVYKNIKILEILSGDCLRILYETKHKTYNEELFYLSSIRCNKNYFYYETINALRKEVFGNSKYSTKHFDEVSKNNLLLDEKKKKKKKKKRKEEDDVDAEDDEDEETQELPMKESKIYLTVDYKLNNNKKYISLYETKTNKNILLPFLRKYGYFHLIFSKYEQKRAEQFYEYFEIFKKNKLKKIGYFHKSVTDEKGGGGRRNRRNRRNYDDHAEQKQIGTPILDFDRIEIKKREKLLKENFNFLKSVTASSNQKSGGSDGSGSLDNYHFGIVQKVYFGNFFKIYLPQKNIIIKLHIKTLFCFKHKSGLYPPIKTKGQRNSLPTKHFGFEARRFMEDLLLFKKVNLQIYNYDVKQFCFVGQIYLHKKNLMEHALKSGYFWLNKNPNMSHKNMLNFFTNLENKVQKRGQNRETCKYHNLWKLHLANHQLSDIFFSEFTSSYNNNYSPNRQQQQQQRRQQQRKKDDDDDEESGEEEEEEEEVEVEGEEKKKKEPQQPQQQRRRREVRLDDSNLKIINNRPILCKITHLETQTSDNNNLLFYIQTSDSKKQIKKLERILTELDLENKTFPENCEEIKEVNQHKMFENKVYCRYFGDWYRGVLLKKIEEEESYLVHYPDYGNTEKVNVAHIKKLKRQFDSPQIRNIPYQSKKVSLAFISISEEKESEMKKRFQKLTRNKEFQTVLEYKIGNLNYISLFEKKSKRNVMKILVKEKLVKVDQKIGDVYKKHKMEEVYNQKMELICVKE